MESVTVQQLGWKAEVDLHSGLRELVAWWRAERVAS
jgi:nucleoside-diphosphate-sugar epimerase